MNQDESWQSIAAGAGISAGLLAFEHVTLWELRGKLPLVARYALGTFAIGAGVTFASPRAARVFWPIAIVSGVIVASAHLIRRFQPQPADRVRQRVPGELTNAIWIARSERN